MPAPVKVRNALDAHTNQAKPTKNFNGKRVMWLQNAAGENKYGWLYFNKPFPPNVIITSATLYLYNVEDLANSTTLTVYRVAEKWKVNRIDWNKNPTVTGTAASQNKATSGPDGEWAIDVKAQLQAVADGAAWYGFRISTSRGVAHKLYASEVSVGRLRPMLAITWVSKPDEPDALTPGNGQVVFTDKPVLRFDYDSDDGEEGIDAVQVRIGTTEANVEAGVVTFDSGEFATTFPQLDLAATTYTPVAAGVLQWWQVRVKDDINWSLWSDATSWSWQSRGTVTMSSPAASPNNFIYEPSPAVSWSVSNMTQKHYQVAVALANRPSDWLWDSGKITGTATSLGIPEGVLTQEGSTYTIILRVWDTFNRAATAGQPMYTEVARTVTFAYDATIDCKVSNLTATGDPFLPIMTLDWTKIGVVAATGYVIQRSEDSGTTWKIVDEVTSAEALVSGSAYRYKDVTAAPYKPYVWRVLPINATNGRMTSGNPTVTGETRRLAPFLYRPDGTDAVCFLNPKRSRSNLDVQELLEPISGPPVLVTQRIGLRGGHVEGRLASEAMAGVSAHEQYLRFQRMRKDAGTPLYVAVANETYKVVAFNFEDDVLTDASGITYIASFDWIEIP